MSRVPNAYESPASVVSTNQVGSRYVVWFVVGALLGVFAGTVWKSSLRFVVYHIHSDPVYNGVIYAIAAVLSIGVAWLSRRFSRPLDLPSLDMGLRMLGGFAFGFTPYWFGGFIGQLFPSLWSMLPSFNSAILIVLNIALGSIISLGVECGAKSAIRGVRATTSPRIV